MCQSYSLGVRKIQNIPSEILFLDNIYFRSIFVPGFSIIFCTSSFWRHVFQITLSLCIDVEDLNDVDKSPKYKNLMTDQLFICDCGPVDPLPRADLPIEIIEWVILLHFETERIVSRSEDDHEDGEDPKENLKTSVITILSSDY